MPFFSTHSFCNKYTIIQTKTNYSSSIINTFNTKQLYYREFVSFSFAEEVSPFDCAHYVTSFDIESLFTNIPLEETINICDDKLFEKQN